MVGDGQRIAVATIAKFELALEVGAPQLVGHGALRQRRAARAMARPAATLMPRMDAFLIGNTARGIAPKPCN